MKKYILYKEQKNFFILIFNKKRGMKCISIPNIFEETIEQNMANIGIQLTDLVLHVL